MIPILVLLIVSAVIAYLGDALGTWVGKRRLTLFNLRPRVTALLVAISTGMLITLTTLAVAAYLSDHVRIALFSVEQITRDLKNLGRERERLQKDIGELRSQVRVKQEELVVFRKDEPLAATVIPASQPVDMTLEELHRFIDGVAARARDRGLRVKDDTDFFRENRPLLASMAGLIASGGRDMVVGAVAAQNISIGEALGSVRFLVRPNDLIFQAGQEIASLEVDGTLERPQIARLLRDFMEEINHEVVRLGMIGNPLTGRFGDLSSESMLSFFDMVNQVRSLGRKLVLIAVVKENTYAIGPLNVSFRLEEEAGEN